MSKRKLTEAQNELFAKVNIIIGFDSIELDRIKILSEFKSFDSSFNALLNK